MNVLILIGIIITAGLLGGAANYYMEKSEGPSFWKSILLGLTASAAVPLFLNTVSSKLLSECLDTQNPSPSAFFVFFGFCTIAAIFSSKFLQTLGDKLLQEVKEVKQKQAELQETTDTLVTQNSDPVEGKVNTGGGNSGLESFNERDASAPALSDEQKIMGILQAGRFAFRTAEGIAKDVGMDAATVQGMLQEMESRGKVKKTLRMRDNAPVWSLK